MNPTQETSPKEDAGEYLTRQDLADKLRLSIRQIDRLKIKKAKIGHSVRFSLNDVNEYLESATNKPTSTEDHSTSHNVQKQKPAQRKKVAQNKSYDPYKIFDDWLS